MHEDYEPGLLDKPLTLEAILSGQHVIETPWGQFVSAHATQGEAWAAALDHELDRLCIIPPVPQDQLHTVRHNVLTGIERREMQGQPISDRLRRVEAMLKAQLYS